MTNIYDSVVNYDDSNERFEQYIRQVELTRIFKGVFEAYPENALKIIKFILYAYSIESELLYVSGSTWAKTSKIICDKVGLDPKLYDVEMLLENEKVHDSINKYLDFQNEENWTQYCTFRELRKHYLEAALFPLPKYKTIPTSSEPLTVLSDPNADAYARMKSMIDAKMAAAKNSEELLEMMRESMNKFIQKNPKLKDSITALNNVTSKKQTASVEDFIK